MTNTSVNKLMAAGFQPAYDENLDIVRWVLEVIPGDVYIVFNERGHSCVLDIRYKEYPKPICIEDIATNRWRDVHVVGGYDFHKATPLKEILGLLLQWRDAILSWEQAYGSCEYWLRNGKYMDCGDRVMAKCWKNRWCSI